MLDSYSDQGFFTSFQLEQFGSNVDNSEFGLFSGDHLHTVCKQLESTGIPVGSNEAGLEICRR